MSTRTRRSHRPRNTATCRRETCNRTVEVPGQRHCCGLCRLIEREQQRAQRLCQAAGHSALTAELWSSVVELSDALTAYHDADRQLEHAAHQSGISPDRWHAIKEGKAT